MNISKYFLLFCFLLINLFSVLVFLLSRPCLVFSPQLFGRLHKGMIFSITNKKDLEN